MSYSIRPRSVSISFSEDQMIDSMCLDTGAVKKVKVDPKHVRSLTEQCHVSEVKMQNVIAKYRRTGLVTHTAKYEGSYMDMPDGITFQDAQNVIATAKSMFESVPSDIRDRFHNRPDVFLDFMQNPDNRAEIESLGLSVSHLPPIEPAAGEVPSGASPDGGLPPGKEGDPGRIVRKSKKTPKAPAGAASGASPVDDPQES